MIIASQRPGRNNQDLTPFSLTCRLASPANFHPPPASKLPGGGRWRFSFRMSDMQRRWPGHAACGLPIGLAAAFGATQALRSLLHEVQPGDPLRHSLPCSAQCRWRRVSFRPGAPPAWTLSWPFARSKPHHGLRQSRYRNPRMTATLRPAMTASVGHCRFSPQRGTLATLHLNLLWP